MQTPWQSPVRSTHELATKRVTYLSANSEVQTLEPKWPRRLFLLLWLLYGSLVVVCCAVKRYMMLCCVELRSVVLYFAVLFCALCLSCCVVGVRCCGGWGDSYGQKFFLHRFHNIKDMHRCGWRKHYTPLEQCPH